MSDHAPRIVLIDQAKALGIVAVVIGHVVGFPRIVLESIFLFHMPLFFFVSGALHGEDKLQMPTATYLRDLLRRLLIPYAFFFALAWMFWLATRGLGARSAKFAAVGWHEPLIAFVSGGALDLIVNPVLWFLPCLALTAAVFQFLRRRLPAGALAVVAALAAITLVPLLARTPADGWPFVDAIGDPRDGRWPWGADLLPATLCFYAAGHAARHGLKREPVPMPGWGRLAIGLIAIAVLAGGRSVFGIVDMNQLYFGRSVAMFLAAGILGITATLMLGSLLPRRSAIMRWLARNTLIVFALHPLAFIAISGIGKYVFRLPPTAMQGSGWGLVQLVLTFVLLVPAAVVLHAVAPSVVGARSSRRSPRLPPGNHSPA